MPGDEECGFCWRTSWFVQISLVVGACALCWWPSFALNVSKWWEAGRYSMAALATAMFVVMIAIPFATKFVPGAWKILAFPLSIWLFYMCFYGAGEMVVKAREDMRVEVQTTIKAGTLAGTALNDYTEDLKKVKADLKKRGDPPNVSDDALKLLREAVQTAKDNECGVFNHKDCTKKAQATKTAQQALTDGQAVHDLYADKLRLGGLVESKTAEVNGIGAIPTDSNKMTAEGMANYMAFLNKIPYLKDVVTIDADALAGRRAMDIALTGEVVSAWGAKFLVALINGLFSGLRSFLCGGNKQLPIVIKEEPQLPMLSQPEMETTSVKLVQTGSKPAHEIEQTGVKPAQTSSLRPPRRESVAEWKMARATDRKDGKCLTATAISDYETWCRNRGEEPVSPTLFGIEIKKLGVRKPDNDRRYYHGIVLKPSLKLVSAMGASFELIQTGQTGIKPAHQTGSCAG